MPSSCTVLRLLAVSLLLASTPARGLEQGSPAGLELRVVNVSPPRVISIELKNVTAHALRLFRESNSWGAARWRVLRVRGGEAALAYQVPVYAFSMNVPGYDELAGQATRMKQLDLGDNSWRIQGPTDLTLDPGDIVVAIYDVPVSSIAQRLSVWNGAVSASTRVPPAANLATSGQPR
jgi:hypothetical protein